MQFLPNTPIKRKLMLIILLTSMVALLLACVAFLSFDVVHLREEMRRDLIGLRAHVADRVYPLMQREDKVAANEALANILGAQPQIVTACIFDRSGKLFAKYRRADQVGYFVQPEPPGQLGFDFSANQLVLWQGILPNEEVGLVYLESDLQLLHARLARYGGIVFCVLIVSMLAAYFLSARLQRVISDPIVHISQVAKIVSNTKNFAVRAEKQGGDEIGSLVDGFNEMLSEIQVRSTALQEAHDSLEKRVKERTQDLEKQITERERAERGLQQQFVRITLLNNITHSILERQDLKQLLSEVLRQLEEHLPAQFGAAFVANPGGNLALSALSLPPRLPAEAALRISQTAVISASQAGLQECLTRKKVTVQDISAQSTPFLQLLRDIGQGSMAGIPLLVEEEVFGALLVTRPGGNGFSETECEFLRMLSEQVALAARQAQLHTQLQSAYDELKQTQQAVMQQQRLRSLGEMASGIAHDINNALSPIIVYAELVSRNEKQLSDNGKRHLQSIKTAGEDIAHIVARMREFYRRREESDPWFPINLNRLAEQVSDLTRPKWRDIPQQNGTVIQLKTDFDHNLPEIQGSASELREALTNLILNAVDAMPMGGILTIRTRRSGPHVAIEVGDTGIGMDEITRNRCLEPFFSTKGQRGTGLGLAMVYGIMERHEGRIEIDSVLGRGTSLRLVFGVKSGPVNALPGGSPAPLVAPMRILCIDDEPLLRQLLKEILEADGHEVTVADGGENGLKIFREFQAQGNPFDILITDLGMPHMDGHQVTSQIKRGPQPVPVVLLTGWGTMMATLEDSTSQADAIVSKPPRISELRETLAKLSEKIRPRK